MGDVHGIEPPPPPPPVIPEPVVHVSEAAQVTHADRLDVLHIAGSDGSGYSVLLPPLRSAEPTPASDDTERSE